MKEIERTREKKENKSPFALFLLRFHYITFLKVRYNAISRACVKMFKLLFTQNLDEL